MIFTVPSEFRTLWRWNREEMANLLFGVAKDVLFELSRDPKLLGARPGVVMALHTWGRSLVFHPHVHCLVTGGGVTKDGEWKPVRNGILLPVHAVRKGYRGRFLARLESRLRANELRLPEGMKISDALELLRHTARKRWNVRMPPPYPHGEGVAIYLARYLRGGPISSARLRHFDGKNVTFSYRDFRSDVKSASMTLTSTEFTSRWLQHVPIPGQKTVRSFGLYHHAARPMLESCRYQLTALPGCSRAVKPARRRSCPKRVCPTCGAELETIEISLGRPLPVVGSGRSPPPERAP